MPSPTPANSVERRRRTALPPPFTDPVVLCDEVCRLGGRSIVERAEAFVGEEAVFYVVRTETRCDVGRWWARPRFWVFAGESALLVGAWGSSGRPGPVAREYRVTYTDLSGYAYDEVAGIFAVNTSHDHHADLPGLRMPPLDGYQLLAQIEKGRERDGPNRSQ